MPSPRPKVVDLADKLSLFSDHWSPKVVARLDDHEVKLVKVKGEFVWHTHDEADELFLVIDGTLVIRLPRRRCHTSGGPDVCRPAVRGALPGGR